jgi:hypothetical protein
VLTKLSNITGISTLTKPSNITGISTVTKPQTLLEFQRSLNLKHYWKLNTKTITTSNKPTLSTELPIFGNTTSKPNSNLYKQKKRQNPAKIGF